MNSPGRQPGAFTLLELLVAMAMTAVLAGSLYATLHVAFKARRTATAAVEQMRKAELAVELIRADLESAVVPKGILAGAFLGQDATDGAARPMDALMLHCAANGAADTEGTGDIHMVELACESDQDGEGMILLRRRTLNLLTTTVEEPDEETLCRGVRSFDLKYFDGADWQDNWDSAAQNNALPRAVEVMLQLVAQEGAGTNKGGYRIWRLFQIPCASAAADERGQTAPR